jgi:small subunit ribosomal protein S3
MKRAVQSAMRLWRRGHPHQLLGPSRRRRDRAHGVVPRRARAAAYARADVDFGVATAFTTYGTCGVKVWIFKGEIMEHDPMAQDKRWPEGEAGRPRRDAA